MFDDQEPKLGTLGESPCKAATARPATVFAYRDMPDPELKMQDFCN
jgi:hypothetical protein